VRCSSNVIVGHIGYSARRVRTVVEQCQLAKEVVGAENRHGEFTSKRTGAIDADLPAGDQVESLTMIALLKDRLALPKDLDLHAVGQRDEWFQGELPQHRNAAQHKVSSFVPLTALKRPGHDQGALRRLYGRVALGHALLVLTIAVDIKAEPKSPLSELLDQGGR
jgi:hypothetical protein